MISNPSKSDQVLAGISLFESAVILLQRFATFSSPEVVSLQADLVTILDACLGYSTTLRDKVRTAQILIIYIMAEK